MYSASADEIWELFGDYVEGNPDAAAAALSARPLSSAARNALEKSLAAFGYGEGALAYATLNPRGSEAGEADGTLDPHAQFLLIEGLDPICLIACDEQAISSLEATYRVACKRNASSRVFGRPCVLLSDIDRMLESDQGKQRLWALMKTLPKLG